MKNVAGAVAVIALLGGATPAMAADWGLGISVRSNDGSIYVPIDIEERWRIEPFVRYLDQDISGQGFSDVSATTLLLGVGGFRLSSLAESARIYYGARLSYVSLEVESVVNVPPVIVNQRESEKQDGYRIAPTLGIEYVFNKRISLAGEAEYFFSSIDGDEAEEQDANGTETRLIIRFRF